MANGGLDKALAPYRKLPPYQFMPAVREERAEHPGEDVAAAGRRQPLVAGGDDAGNEGSGNGGEARSVDP